MLVVAKFKEGEGKFEKFMGFMQSPEGLAERAKVAVEGTIQDEMRFIFSE